MRWTMCGSIFHNMGMGSWFQGSARILAAGGLLSLAACLPRPPEKNPHLVTPPPTPAGIKPVPHTFAWELIVGRKVSGVTMRVFDAGLVRGRGEGISSLKSYHAKLRLPVPVFLISHPTQGLILFETGPDPASVEKPWSVLDILSPYALRDEVPKGKDLLAQLSAEGISPKDIRWVIVSHLHPEPAGRLAAFPEATVVVSRREWEWRKARSAAGKRGEGVDPEGLEGRVKLRLLDIHNAPAFGAFANGLDLFEDGSLVVVGLPGHSPGNIGVWANLDGGPVLMTGGAAFVVDNLDLALPVKEHFRDLDDFWRSIHEIRAMREGVPQLVVLPAHDLSPLSLTRRADIPLVIPRREK